MRSRSFILAGCIGGLGFLSSPAFPETAPSSPSTPALVYLQVQTATGKSLKAPVKSFKGLSLGVVATLVKEGKMKEPPEKETNPPGQMVFLLDKNCSDDFLAWAMSPESLAGDPATTGQFEWTDPTGKHTETFNMKGLKVVSFTPAGAMGTPYGILIVVADHTDADPPLNFHQGSPTPQGKQ